MSSSAAERTCRGAVLDDVVDASLAGVARLPDRVKDARRDAGELFVAPELALSAPFAEQLGLKTLPSGWSEVDALGRTSRPGVYASHDPHRG